MHRRAIVAAVLGGGALWAAVALAITVAVGPLRERDGLLWAEVRLGELFAPRVQQSLERGMPATLLLHAELWRHRTAWFDRLESNVDAEFRIRYEVVNERFRIDRRDTVITLGSLEALRAELARPLALAVARSDALDPRHTYYVVVEATLKPLSVEDFEEGEGWLSGEVETHRHSGFGILTGIPRSVLDAARNFAGFGDLKARAVTPDFDGSEPEAE